MLIDQLEGRLSVSSVHVVIRVLRTCLSTAREKELLAKNPVTGVRLPIKRKKRSKALSVNEQKQLKETAQSSAIGLAVVLALETGTRIGEISELKWSGIDWVSEA